jgi:hypothetical protein
MTCTQEVKSTADHTPDLLAAVCESPVAGGSPCCGPSVCRGQACGKRRGRADRAGAWKVVNGVVCILCVELARNRGLHYNHFCYSLYHPGQGEIEEVVWEGI